MDHMPAQGVGQMGTHSPDSGTWVSFEDGSSSTTAGGGGGGGNEGGRSGISPAEVNISLPPPPRRSDFPHPTHPDQPLVSLPTSVSPQYGVEREEVERVQRILMADSVFHSTVDLPEEPSVTIRIDDRENGRILSTIRPTNDRCAWIVPSVYHPERVPQKVAEVLQVPLEDYVMNLDVLISDYRFRIYVVLYKRIIGIWLFITLIVLLSLLFSGLRGLSLFAAGLIWLIIAGSGMCVCLYAKKKMSDGLKLAVAHANKFMVKQRLIIGVEDRGKLSLQKVVLPIIHYDVLPCLAFIAQLLEDTKLLRVSNGAGVVNVYNPSNLDMDAQDTSPMDKAEQLMLRCVQPYVKEFVKRRLVFHVTKVEDVGLEETRPPSEHPQLFPRHCQGAWCLCQFVERMVIRRKPRKWFRKIWNEEV